MLCIAVMTSLVYHIMEDVYHRMLEYLTVLVLIVFSDGLEGYTNSAISVSLQMLRSFLCSIEDMIVYCHILLIALTIELQFIMWQQRRFAILGLSW